MSPDEFYQHAMRHADAEGRLPLPSMTGWEIFPFEQADLRTIPLARPVVPEPGDGGAHLHIFFYARPAGFSQLRGTCLPIWDDLLPAVPSAQHAEDAAAVAQAISRSCAGRPHPVMDRSETAQA